jgi:hypothetical protein
MTTLPASALVKHQKIKVEKLGIIDDGIKCDLVIEIRHDDECGNGHNSFGITGTLYKAGKRSDRATITCGCIHDTIIRHAPELAPFIKWHLTSTDEPMHYVSNAVFHARDCDTDGKQVGDAIRFDQKLKFKGFPIQFELNLYFLEFLIESQKFNPSYDFEVIAIDHDNKEGYNFKPKFTFGGYGDEWHTCPFDTEIEALNFLEALQAYDFEVVKVATKWAEAVKPNLGAARSSAVWLDANLSDFTEEKLEARLPELMHGFKKDVELLGFVY